MWSVVRKQPNAAKRAKSSAATTSSAASVQSGSRKRACVSVTLEELIQRRRDALIQLRQEAPDLRARALRMRSEADAMTARYQFRRKMDLASQAAALEKEASVRESRSREMEFEFVAADYLRAAKQASKVVAASPSLSAPSSVPTSPAQAATTSADAPDDEAATSDGRVITVPGAERETARRHLNTSSLREARRQLIVHEFEADVERAAPRLVVRSRDACPFCDKALLLNGVKSMLVCTACGYSVAHLDSTTQSVSYTEEYDFSSFSYKRQSHFDDLLKLVQGKESLVVPDEVITAVMRELHAQRVKKEDITQTKVRNVLRKLRMRRAYDHVAQITTTITGVRPPRISAENEEKCRRMFARMQPAFERFCPPSRKNFLNYVYVLFRVFHVLGLDYMLPSFSLLKCKEKLKVHDQIFSQIAESLGWKFVAVDEVLRSIKGIA